MGELYMNPDMQKPSAASPNQPGPLGPRAKGTGRRGWGPVALGLGLLCVGLLAGLLILGVRHSVTVMDLSVTQSKLTERQKELSTLGKERSQLNSSLFSLKQRFDELSTLGKERSQLNSSLFSLKQRFDELLKENIRRNPTCPEGWRKFENACYHLSDQRDSWNNSRNDCIAKGGDLVVIDSSQEQKFISEYKGYFWIGLSDLEQEGTWKWVDGAPLILNYWEKTEPNNGGGKHGEEDCAHTTEVDWNDLSCGRRLRRICEASALDA